MQDDEEPENEANMMEVKVPDIGDFADVPVVEILVKPGDLVVLDDPLIALESDKATMEVPSPAAGRVSEIIVNLGDKVSKDTLILKLETEASDAAASPAKADDAVAAEASPSAVTASRDSDQAKVSESGTSAPPSAIPPPADFSGVHASPSVRRLARELDVDLTQIKGSGEHGRILREDLKRSLATSGAAAGGSDSLSVPKISAPDYAKFGPVSATPLSRLKRLSGAHLHRAWLNVPHVTHNDEADITELDAYRKKLDEEARAKGYRVTLLSFLLMASTLALKRFPTFNASLAPDTEELIQKNYYNIGVAVDTPDGLVVPVIKDVDRKRILELSQELSDVSQRMRDGKIAPADIQGGTFSISSLGGIGGTNFTPIVNAPEVAILGVVRAQMRPQWNGESFEPRLMLPLCLSYDHRVIDGALAARFTRHLAELLGDVRQLLL